MKPSDRTKYFLPLEAVAAGFHDGRSLVIGDGHISSMMIYGHELAHGRIFQESLDGVLHLCVLAALDNPHFVDDRPALTELNAFLFSSTREAHEKIATYLGVQGLSTDKEIDDAVGTLPQAYLDYYGFFDKSLSCLPASHLRYGIAWAAGRLAFSSGRTKAIAGQSLVASLQTVLGPNERLALIGDYLEQLGSPALRDFVTDCADRAFAQCDVEPFDFMDDSIWSSHEESDRVDVQLFDSALIFEFGNSLAVAVALEEFRDTAFEGYFAPLKERFTRRESPILLNADGTVREHAHALEIAAMADDMRISRGSVLASQPYSRDRIFDWIERNASKPVYLSTVELSQRRGFYKIFLSNGLAEGSTYAEGSPCIINGKQLSEIFSHLQSSCRRQKALIPPVFLFSEQGTHGESEFVDLTVPARTKSLQWRPGRSLRAGKHIRFVRFFLFPHRWSGLIDRCEGTWTQVDTTIDIPQEGERFNLAVAYVFPREKEWIPYLRLMTIGAASLYRPLLQTPHVKAKLEYITLATEDEVIVRAALAVWETLDRI